MLEITPYFNDVDKKPLYIQLYEHIRDEIQKGRIKPSTRLPSIRKCTEHLRIGRNTVETAYQQLIAEGYVESRPRSGLYVVEIESDLLPSKNHTIKTPIHITIDEKEKTYKYNFIDGNVDLNHFPFSIWRKLSNQCLQPDRKDLLIYGHPKGEPGLQYEIAKYLRLSRGY